MDLLLHELPLVLITMVFVEYVERFGHRHHFGKALDQLSKFVAHLFAQIPLLILPILQVLVAELANPCRWFC